jgi:integrase
MTDVKTYWKSIQIQTTSDAGPQQATGHRDVAALIRALRSNHAESMAKLQLQWITLSACRNSDAQLIKHSEINLDDMTWTIPAERRKACCDHVVPITDGMAELLLAAASHQPALADYVFVTQGSLLQAAKCSAATGIRAAFREWATAEAKFPLELVHAQLGHGPSTVEAAYSCKSVMEAWAAYVMGAANV